jgi:hypothetical protein
MDLFESTDVEGSSVLVIYDCNNSSTTTGSAVVAGKTSTWNSQIATRHLNADQAESTSSEACAHGISNSEFLTIRSQIPNP